MNRAQRRAQQGKVVKEKVYTLTQSQIDTIKRDAESKAVNTAFTLMMAIPLEVLIGEGYWEKSAKRKLPKFLEEVLSLYDAWEKGTLTIEELRADLKEYGGIELQAPKNIEHY